MTQMQGHEQNAGHVLPRDTNLAIKAVMESVKAIGAVYSEETKALDALNTSAFMALQDQKIVVAQQYQAVMGQMLARQHELKMADPALKERLKALHNEFSTLSARNVIALERMQRCTKRLGDTIRNAAIKDAHSRRGYSYSETGAIPESSNKKAVSSGLSETV